MPKWIQEACDNRPDPVTGAEVTRLTSAIAINNNIYCEQPYGSSDGRRIVFVRHWGTPGFDARSQIFVADLERIMICPVEQVTTGNNAAWGDWFHYVGPGNAIMAFTISGLEHKVVTSNPQMQTPAIGALSPDGRYMITREVLPGPTIGIFRFDTLENRGEIIFDDPEIVNPHLQFNPVDGQHILVQHNRGSRMSADGTVENYDRTLGCTLFRLDADGSNRTQIPAGPPWTAGCTGHECFLADTGKVMFSVHWNLKTGALDDRWPHGNLFTAVPGTDQPTVFPAPEHRFNHVCASRCGKYFVADSYRHGLPGPVPLVVGNLETGKHRELLADCRASCGGAQYNHPHAYFTADTRRVVYNADPKGVPHIFVATVPDGFLESLG